MKNFTLWQLTVALLLISNFSFSQIISQYVETNSGSTPKGLEIWNNTAGTLDFSTSALEVFKGTNGGAPAVDFTLNTGTLAAGEVIVIGTADMEAIATGNGAAFHLKGFTFNGDDALEIHYGGTITDVFGEPGTDPGSSWDGNGVSTRNQNIALLAGITDGSLTGWSDPSTRFETVSTTPSTLPDGLIGFGIAPAGGTPTEVAAPTFSPAPGTYYSTQNVTLACSTPGVDIYYTVDGTDPDNTSTLFAAPINVASTTTIKAIGIDPTATLADSPISTGVYTISSGMMIPDLATLRTQATDGTVYILSSEVVLTFAQSYRNQKFVQDGTAGILIDDAPGKFTTAYNVGDGITGIIGVLTTYNGMLQFVPQIDAGAATSTGNVVSPQVISATEFTTNFEAYEGQLVKLINLTFADAGTNFANGQVYAATDGNGVSVDFRTSFYSVDYIGTPIPAGENIVVGIANDRNNPYLTARDAADFSPYAPVIPLNSMGIIIAGLLLAAVVVIRKGRLF